MNQPDHPFLALLARYLRPRWPAMAAIGVVLSVNIALQLVNPQIIGRFIDTAQRGGAVRTLFEAAAFYIAIALVGQSMAIVETYVAENVGWGATNELRSALARHCLRLDRAFHAARTPGELIERIDGDVTALANFFSRFIIYVLGNALLLVGVLVMLFRIDLRVGAALGVFAGGAIALLVALRRITVPLWTAVRQNSAEYFGFIGERLAGTEDVRANGGGAYVLRRHTEILRRWLPLEVRAGVGWSIADGGNVLIFTIGNAIAFAVSAYLFRSREITLGTVYLIFQYTELLRSPLEQIRSQLQDSQKAAASVTRVQQLLATTPAIADGDGAILPAGPLAMDFEAVTFGYDDGAPVLHEVTFAVPSGQTLGVLGHTGSGKTTLSRLLLRFHDPDRGRVSLGGVDLRRLRLADLRRHVGLVTQEVQLFHATLRDNLTLFDPHIADHRVIEVLAELGLGPWYRSLPNGLDSELTGGGGLSAGEGQLLAFARVFLRSPGLVVLDEASSRLDPATERLVARATERLLHGRTGVIIAHRLATIRHVDAIVILDRGRVVEYGRYADLASNPRSRLVQLLQTGLEVAYA